MTADDPNKAAIDEWTPIHAAAAFGYLDIVKFLVPLAVNPNSRNGKIRAPIHTARDNGHHEIVNILEPFDYDF